MSIVVCYLFNEKQKKKKKKKTFQGTAVLRIPQNHPMHMHGYSFYVVGSSFGNFNNETDPKNFNLVDQPEVNIVEVPKNGWVTIRFKANNPGKIYSYLGLY